MRASLILYIFLTVLGLFLYVTLSGAALVFAFLALGIFLIVSIGYPDTAILFFLGARAVRSGDEVLFYEAAARGAYKLAVPLPELYFYNGALDRGFVLHRGKKISLVLSRSLLENVQSDELAAICFELLLQVKKGMASKRTKVMFLIGSKAWAVHSLSGLVFGIIPVKEFKQASEWVVNYLLHPWLDLLFSFSLGQNYFKKLEASLSEFPLENEMMSKLMLKLPRPEEIHSLPSRKLIELSSTLKSRQYQNILALELMPHEWDYFSAQKT